MLNRRAKQTDHNQGTVNTKKEQNIMKPLKKVLPSIKNLKKILWNFYELLAWALERNPTISLLPSDNIKRQ